MSSDHPILLCRLRKQCFCKPQSPLTDDCIDPIIMSNNFTVDNSLESGRSMHVRGANTQNLEGNIQNEGVLAQNVAGQAQVIGKQLSKPKF